MFILNSNRSPKTPSILFLLSQDLESPSGLGRYWPLAKELARLGHRVQIAALHSNYSALKQKEFEKNGVKILYVSQMHVQKNSQGKKYFPSWRLLQVAIMATLKLSRTALSTPADLIFVGKPHPMNGIAGSLTKILKRKRLVVDCDDYEAASSTFKYAWQKRGVVFFENRLPLYADCVTSNTHFTLDRLSGLGVPKDLLVYLPNGVDRDRFRAERQNAAEQIRAPLKWGGGKIVAFIGSLSLASHPVDLLLEAFHRVHRASPNAHLMLVGGGESLAFLQKESDQLGLTASVFFTGKVPPEAVPLYYRLADVIVDPVFDNDAARGRSPLKMFESWASGVPFITGEVGDRALVSGSPPASLLVTPGDPQTLADGILEVLSSQALSSSLISRGADRINLFYWDRLAKELATFLIPEVS